MSAIPQVRVGSVTSLSRSTSTLLALLMVVPSAAIDSTYPSATSLSPAPLERAQETDATAEVQALIDRAPDGGVVRLSGGRYRIEGTLVVEERRDLTIDGNGSTLFATTTGTLKRSHLRVIGGRDIVVHDLTIIGANPKAGLVDGAYQPALEGQHGIRLEGVTNIEVTRVRVQDVYGDFVYVGRREGDSRFSDGVWIHESTFARSGRQGIAVTAGRNIVIERNHITHTARASIDLEPNTPTWGADNVHVLDNEVGPGNLMFLAAAGNGPVNEVVIARNQLRGRVLNSIVRARPGGARRHGFYFVDNVSDMTALGTTLKIWAVDGLVITGNTQPISAEGAPLVVLDDTCDEWISANDVGPGGIEVDGPLCGTPPDPAPPEPPAAAGRPLSGVAPPTTTTTTSTLSAAPSVPEEGASGEGDARSGRGRWLLVAGGGFIAAMALLWRDAGRRRAQRGEPRRREPSSRR